MKIPYPPRTGLRYSGHKAKPGLPDEVLPVRVPVAVIRDTVRAREQETADAPFDLWPVFV